jgi:glycosyltransferase involved in cell wall biosynthesis
MVHVTSTQPLTVDCLPFPGDTRSGWPWTAQASTLPKIVADDLVWPKITVVTPSYNQASFLEETIRSVLLQGYPGLEYIVIDGGSTDGSQEIIRKYSRWITYWISEPDHGQTDAINKGLAMATGELVNFVNSDDLLTPGALFSVARAFDGHDLVAGKCQNFSRKTDLDVITNHHLSARAMIRGDSDVVFHQPAVWLRRVLIRECGGFQSDLNYAFDWDLCIRYVALFPRVHYIPATLARFRLHDGSKTVASPDNMAAERTEVVRRLFRNDRFRMLRSVCDRRLRQNAWWETLQQIDRDYHPHSVKKAFALMRLALKDPPVRCSRLTAGAIRRTAPWVH